MRGIVAYGVYLPYWRLDRKAIGEALGSPSGSGTRAVASYDEDTTSLGVEAARAALRGVRVVPQALYFATANPAYLDKTNATAIHAALDLPTSALAVDMVGSVRSMVGAMRAARDTRVPAITVLSDVRTGLPGGGDERDGGDGASAFVFAEDGADARVLVEPVAAASATAEFLDRWRLPGENASHQWEERFGEHAYVPLGQSVLAEALKQAGLDAPRLAHLVVAGPHGRAVKRVAAAAGARKEAIGDDFSGSIGNTGTAHAGIMFADALDRAQPDDLIAVVSLSDGADASIWRVTGATKRSANVGAQLAGGGRVSYPTFLAWRGFLEREPPRRPDPQPPEAPPSLRSEAWKFAFTGSRCQACGTRHLPPQRVCVKCKAIDRMAPERLADVPAAIATFTVDRLAFSPSPPMVVAVLDFEGGGRFQSEMTDVDPKAVKIGDRVAMTFRRIITAGGVHNYFWKARPIGGSPVNRRAAFIPGVALVVLALAPAAAAEQHVLTPFQQQALRAIRAVMPGVGLSEPETTGFALHADRPNAPDLECRHTASFKLIVGGGEIGAIGVGVCPGQVARLRALAAASVRAFDARMADGQQDRAPVSADKLRALGWYRERSTLPPGGDLHYFPVFVIGHGFFAIPTVILLTDTQAVIAQTELTEFCGEGGKPFPLCADPKGTLSAIAQRLLR